MLKKIPDTLVIVFSILVLMALLTWIIPPGRFDRMASGDRTDIVVPGSYQATDAQPQGLWALMCAPFKGFSEAAHIIAFVLLVGGAFSVVMGTGAIDAGLARLIRLTASGGRARSLLLVLIMFLFSLCGFTFGMSEESLVFVLITIPLARNMGYDAIVGVAIPFVTSGVGGAAAAYNPFGVGVAMEIAGLPFPSGVGLRTLAWLMLTAISIAFIMVYARRVEKDPSKSLMAGIVSVVSGTFEAGHFTPARLIVVLLFMATLVIIPFGAAWWDWGVLEIGAAFLALGFVSGAVARMSPDAFVRFFSDGARGMIPAVLVICISRSVLIIAREGQVIDTILFHLSGSLQGLPKSLSVQLMFFVQGLINFFVPSGSGQAAITMPLMAPLADLIGLTRQSAVMAFQLAAGFFDLVIPTSFVTMGVLSVSGVPYNRWLKWIWKLVLLWIVFSCIFLAVTAQLDTWW